MKFLGWAIATAIVLKCMHETQVALDGNNPTSMVQWSSVGLLFVVLALWSVWC